MINLILAIVALLSVKVNGETVACNANGGTCSCRGSRYAGKTCTLNCVAVDICKDATLTCRAGDPCVIVCSATTACAGNTVIDASGATDVTITCSGVDSCKGSNVDITCGTGTCALECLTYTSCEDAVVTAGNAEVLTCTEPAYCDRAVMPPYDAPPTTAAPITTIATTATSAAITAASTTAASMTAASMTATSMTATSMTATSMTATSNATTLTVVFSQEECDALIAEHLSVSMSESVSDSPSDSVSVDNSISLSFDSAEFTDNATLALIQQFLDFCGLECEMEYVGLVSGVDIGSFEVVTCDCDLVECKSALQFGAAQRFASGTIIGFALTLMLFVLN